MKENKTRCFGSAPGKEFYAEYHDKEWGVPVYDDKHLFEMLILEGAQAGLSWETVLKRREEYRKAFHHFDPAKVAKMTDDELNNLLQIEHYNTIPKEYEETSIRKSVIMLLKQRGFPPYAHNEDQMYMHHENARSSSS